MATETQVNVPESLFHRLQERARLRGITVDVEASELLSKALEAETHEAKLLEEIRKDREEMARQGVYITDDFIQKAKQWGRE